MQQTFTKPLRKAAILKINTRAFKFFETAIHPTTGTSCYTHVIDLCNAIRIKL